MLYYIIYTPTGFLLFLIDILCSVHREKMVDGITCSLFIVFFFLLSMLTVGREIVTFLYFYYYDICMSVIWKMIWKLEFEIEENAGHVG